MALTRVKLRAVSCRGVVEFADNAKHIPSLAIRSTKVDASAAEIECAECRIESVANVGEIAGNLGVVGNENAQCGCILEESGGDGASHIIVLSNVQRLQIGHR